LPKFRVFHLPLVEPPDPLLVPVFPVGAGLEVDDPEFFPILISLCGFQFSALELSGGPQNVERLRIFREAGPYYPVRSFAIC
jgi:hypothetical protein